MFDPEDYVSLSQVNSLTSCSEAQQRTAMSRLYYAAFLLSREFISAKRKAPFTTARSVHQDVVREMKTWDYDLGADLDQLRQARNDADYDLTMPLETVMQDYSSHYDNARHLISTIRREWKRMDRST